LGVDRPLDMLRTTNNVTGDATVASVVAASEDELADLEDVKGDGATVRTEEFESLGA
jgi:Na+/H+-dicarboxylate symporter